MSGLVVNGKAVSKPKPDYPESLKAPEGASMLAKYTPTTLCGRPVKVSGVMTYNFVPR